MQVENWYVPAIRALNLMNDRVSISTSAYSIYNAANRNDADNSSWFRIIRRCTYRSSITSGMYALYINSDSMTFAHKNISSCRDVFMFSVSEATPSLLFVRFQGLRVIVENSKNPPPFIVSMEPDRATCELKRRRTWRTSRGVLRGSL